MSHTDRNDEAGGAEALPVEKGEKRREAAENPREDDRSEDYVEWCLSEFEKTMNRPEEPAPKKSDEEPLRFVDEFIGKGTIPKKEEAEPKHEDVLRFDTGEGHTITHEDQEAMNKPTKGSGVAAEASKIEEHKTDADEGSQPTNEGTQSPHSSEGNLRQEGGRGEQEAERSREATREPSQSLEQQHQHNGAEPRQHSETSPTERPNLDHSKEADSNARQSADHQEEKRVPLRLNEDPQAFAEGNRELLVKQGIILEKDEAKLDDKTTVKFDVNDGLTITHKDQHYKITTVEQEKIGDMGLRKYKTAQGEEFLHVPSENKVAPPYETPWYALPANTEVYLDKNYKHRLLEDAVDKAGGKLALQRELEARGTYTNPMYVHTLLRDRGDGMRADKLIPIMAYLGRNLDELNGHITALGHRRAVENPNAPFKLDSVDGARLVAARLSDGSLSGPQGKEPKAFEYANNDVEQRYRVAESLTNVFGKPHILAEERENDKVARIRTTTEVIGQALKRAGATTGEVVKQNPHVPTFILGGSTELKREWLVQAFGDEGSATESRARVRIGRSVEASSILSKDMVKHLEQMSWKDNIIHGQLVSRSTSCAGLPPEIYEVVKNHPPNLLQGERKMLEDLGVNTKMFPSEMVQGKKGDYSVHWLLQTSTREDCARFLAEIGFPQERKQNKLMSALGLRRPEKSC